MPQTSEKAEALEDIDAAIVVAAYAYLLASDEVEEEEVEELEEIEEEHIQDLLAVRDIIAIPPPGIYLVMLVQVGMRLIFLKPIYSISIPRDCISCAIVTALTLQARWVMAMHWMSAMR